MSGLNILESRQQEYDDGPPRRGISDLVALALITLDLDIVQRSTVRALCPTGRRTHHATGELTKGKTSTAFRGALQKFDRAGWIKRDGNLVKVLDRAALREWIRAGVDTDVDRAWSLLAVAQAVKQINMSEPESTLSTADVRTEEVRRQELIALKRLMESGPGVSHSGGSRSVRIIPRGGVL